MAEEPARLSEAPTMRKALKQAFGDDPADQLRIDAAEYDALYPLEDEHAHEKHYGSAEEWMWDPWR